MNKKKYLTSTCSDDEEEKKGNNFQFHDEIMQALDLSTNYLNICDSINFLT